MFAAGGALLPSGARAGGPRTRVIHVHHGLAARWSRDASYYRQHVDQGVVSEMLDAAVKSLKGLPTVAAWRAVFALSNNATRKLAIKVNLNNSKTAVDGARHDIDAVPHPVIAAIRGFASAGGNHANVTVYDATNTDPTRFIATWFCDAIRAWYPFTKFHAAGGGDSAPGTYLDQPYDAATHVTWDSAHVNPPPRTRVAQIALDADYLVNIPLVKRHCATNVTLGFKNHFGSIDRCDRLHPWVEVDVTTASLLADVMASPQKLGDPSVRSIAQKTVLTVGDLLYGQPCSNFDHTPRPWQTWRREWPNSLIVSDNVVAADSVMLDLLEAEPANDGDCGLLRSWARRHLQIAEQKGLGPHETVPLPAGAVFDASRMNYTKFDYRYVDLQAGGAYLNVAPQPGGATQLSWSHYFPGPCEVQRSGSADFASYTVLGITTDSTWYDANPPGPSFYRVLYAG